MEQLKIPEGYSSPLTIRETEVAIKEVKDHFERALAKALTSPCLRSAVRLSGLRTERQLKRRGASCRFRYQGAG